MTFYSLRRLPIVSSEERTAVSLRHFSSVSDIIIDAQLSESMQEVEGVVSPRLQNATLLTHSSINEKTQQERGQIHSVRGKAASEEHA